MQGATDDTDVSADRCRWTRLAELIAAADRRGLAALDADELDEFAHLYRRAVVDLSRARSRARDRRVIAYLNDLVGRAAGLIYGGRARRRINLREFFLVTVPRTFRETWAYTAIALALFALPALVAYVAATGNPAWADALVAPGLGDLAEDFLSRDVPPGQYFADSQAVIGADNLSGAILVNNLKVALLSFAAGITAALGTLVVMVRNGLMLGAFMGVFGHHGHALDAVGIVAPHGFLELSAIFLCGGAGLMIGWALIAPGDRPRGEALTDAARRAVVLVLAAGVMLGVAALVEGFVSPQKSGLMLTNESRVLFGATLFLVAFAWLLMGDRLAPHDEPDGAREPLRAGPVASRSGSG